MLALKKKREAEKKQAEEDAAKAEAAASATPGAASPAPAAAGQVSLFGIGGEKKSKKGEQQGAKKTPGEIRIQKGKSSCCKLIVFLRVPTFVFWVLTTLFLHFLCLCYYLQTLIHTHTHTHTHTRSHHRYWGT